MEHAAATSELEHGAPLYLIINFFFSTDAKNQVEKDAAKDRKQKQQQEEADYVLPNAHAQPDGN